MTLAHRAARLPVLNFAVELGAALAVLGILVVALQAHARWVWGQTPPCMAPVTTGNPFAAQAAGGE